MWTIEKTFKFQGYFLPLNFFKDLQFNSPHPKIDRMVPHYQQKNMLIGIFVKIPSISVAGLAFKTSILSINKLEQKIKLLNIFGKSLH